MGGIFRAVRDVLYLCPGDRETFIAPDSVYLNKRRIE